GSFVQSRIVKVKTSSSELHEQHLAELRTTPDYIERKEKYRDRRFDVAHGNMPEWATCFPISGRRLTSLNVRTVRPMGT
ncbi:hypothetical protein ACLB1N_36655, partial [Escherichia coli]